MNFVSSYDLNRTTWQLCPGQRLQMLGGEDESVIFNDLSGETHLLSAIAVTLLERLKEHGPSRIHAIASELSVAWEFESEDDAHQVTQKLLSDLDALGLIKALSS